MLKQDYFKQWMRLSIGTPTEAWFDNLLDDKLDVDGIAQFDWVCRVIEDKMYEITVSSMQNRKKEIFLFEYDLHKFHQSEDFA